MEIILDREWMNNPKGAKLNLRDNIAKDLIERGTAHAKNGDDAGGFGKRRGRRRDQVQQ